MCFHLCLRRYLVFEQKVIMCFIDPPIHSDTPELYHVIRWVKLYNDPHQVTALRHGEKQLILKCISPHILYFLCPWHKIL